MERKNGKAFVIRAADKRNRSIPESKFMPVAAALKSASAGVAFFSL